jgi:hypothetical protein
MLSNDLGRTLVGIHGCLFFLLHDVYNLLFGGLGGDEGGDCQEGRRQRDRLIQNRHKVPRFKSSWILGLVDWQVIT